MSREAENPKTPMQKPPTTDARAALAAPARGGAGFTFIEIIVVMGIMAMLLGLALGFLRNVGRAALAQQAAWNVGESGMRCQNSSAGNRTATFLLEEQDDGDGFRRLVIRNSLQTPILTANFEAAAPGSPEWFFKADAPDLASAVGDVKVVEDPAGTAVFGQGSYLDFHTRAIFAVTDGIGIDVAVKPVGGRASMVLLRGTDSEDESKLYEVVLEKDGISEAYRVLLRVRIAPVRAGRSESASLGSLETFQTQDAPVLPGAWSRLSLTFDGRDARMSVNGLDRVKRDPVKKGVPPSPTPERRFVLPKSGAAHLTLSAPGSGYVGSVDTLSMTGIFRTDEDVRELRGDVKVLRPSLPVRAVFTNGRLDPAVHMSDVVILLGSDAEPDAGAYEIRFGLYGSIPPVKSVPMTAADLSPPTTPDTPGTGAPPKEPPK